jgi:hypothetical protein
MQVLGQFKVGTYTGTGAALSTGINELGFKPTCVIAYNETDGDLLWFHIRGMAAATAATVVLATAKVATQGCTLTNTGFTLGTDVTVNESAKVYVYIAF